jgi:hypothetical protein
MVPASPAAAQQPERRLAVHTYPIRMLNGLETMRLDATKITAYRGSATDNTGKFLLVAERSITADIMIHGVGGRDGRATADDLKEAQATGTAIGPHATYADQRFASVPLAGWYIPVYVGRSADRNEAGQVPAQLILTRMQSSQVVNTPDTLAIAPEFDVRRSSPSAHYFDPASGFRPMICHGWPKAFCVWTIVQDGPLFIQRGLQGTGELVEVDASDFVPPTGRILRLQITVRSTGGQGTVSVQTGGSGAGLDVATVTRAGEVARTVIELSPTSKRRFRLRAPKGVAVDLVALGFSMLQPS